MGMQVEFNWYLVLKEEPQHCGTITPEHELIEYLQAKKSGARLYPIGGVVPVIENDKATGLAHIHGTQQVLQDNEIVTLINYDVIMEFEENDPVGEHYTKMYTSYKQKQEVENHGGQFSLTDYLNALERHTPEKSEE